MQSVENLFNIKHDNAIGRMQMESTICVILAAQLEEYEQIFYAAPQVHLSPDELKKVRKITAYIEQNLMHKHTVLSLTKQSGLSQKKLQSAFNAIYQTTIIKFVNDLKLEKSRELLMKKPLNISEISYALGFSNRSYFNFLFKRKFGTSPRKYRKYENL